VPVAGKRAARAPTWFGRRAAWVSAALMIGVTCSAAAGPAWREVRQRNSCEAMRDDYCVGRYGFAVKPDGSFVAGPSQSGRQIGGRIRRAELRKLNALILSAAPTIGAGETKCEPGGLVGIRDQLDVAFDAGAPVRLYDLGGQVRTLCVSGARDRVDKLHDYVRALMNRYYRVPFLG
jgi:hypothetical protein